MTNACAQAGWVNPALRKEKVENRWLRLDLKPGALPKRSIVLSIQAYLDIQDLHVASFIPF